MEYYHKLIDIVRQPGGRAHLSPGARTRLIALALGYIEPRHRLNLLEKRGLIARHKSPDDGRSFRVRLTKQGRDLALEAYKADLEVEARLLEGLSDADRANLTDLLRKLHLLVERNSAGSSQQITRIRAPFHRRAN